VNEARHPAPASPGDRGAIFVPCGRSERTLADRLLAARNLGADDIVVDLGEAEMVGSSTLTTLCRLGRDLRASGGRLAVVCVRPTLVRFLRLTLLDRAFDVYGSREAALRRPS
jgi:anti-anti-sigma factor